MNETVNQETIENVEPEVKEEKKEEKLFTQDEVNGFFKKRYSEMMSQLNEFKDKAAKYDELEEANKTELQKATERAEKLEAELNSLKKVENVRSIREKVAKETGIPLDSMSLLTGETEEECMDQAKTILSISQPGSYPQIPDGGEIQNVGKGSARELFKTWAAQVNN